VRVVGPKVRAVHKETPQPGAFSLLVVTDRPYCGEHSVKPTALRTVLASIETRVV